MVPPQLTICNYQPFSVPVMWNIAHNTDTFPKLQIFNTIIATIDGLREIRQSVENTRNGIQEQGRRRRRGRHKRSGGSDLLEKLIFIRGELGRKPLTFTLLRNIHNTTFDQIFDELGPSLEDTIRYCTNAGITCAHIMKMHSALFPKCFVYATQENKSNIEVSDEGIDNGVSLVLNSGAQLAAKAFTRYSNTIYRNALFQNTFLPFSADGIRLIIHSPGVMPNVDQQGINISPGQSTLIAITGKEVIRKSWPYSRCTSTDHELQMLRKSVTRVIVDDSISNTLEDYRTTYTQQDCRSACLQRVIWRECRCLDIKSRLPFSDINDKLLCGTLEEGETEKLFNPEKHGTQNCIKSASELISDKCRFLHKVINDLACVKEAKEKFTKRKLSGETGCRCPSPCYSYHYIVSISQAPWPAAGIETHAAYRNLVHPRHAKWNLDGMDEIQRLVLEYYLTKIIHQQVKNQMICLEAKVARLTHFSCNS